jgi:hypothetical protein
MERERKEMNAIELLESGVDPAEVSNLLRIPLSEVARIEVRNQARRKFLRTGTLPFEHGGVFTIYQS